MAGKCKKTILEKSPLPNCVFSVQVCFSLHFSLHYITLEIQTFNLGSRILDMALWDEPNIECQSVCSL